MKSALEQYLKSLQDRKKLDIVLPEKTQVTCRLDSDIIKKLSALAKELGESRTGLAQELLRCAIIDATAVKEE